jgi:putative peptidoglycan lipid II flippase
MGILNSHHHFFSPALSPVILDLVWIAGVIWVSPLGGPEAEKRIFLLAVCLLISGAIQLGVQVPFLIRCGFKPRFLFDFLDPAVGRIGKLILPAVLGFAVVQVNILVDMTLAFWVGPGANSSLWYGNRLMQFPLGVFAIAMGTALLPAISQHTARQELDAAKRTLSFALRSVFLIIFPATAGLIVLRTPIVQLLFERGEFDAVSTARTSFVVLCYTIGLFAYSGQKLIVTGFYSLQDTKTPMKIGAIALAVNLVLNLILMGPLKEGGLALATSIAGIFNFLCLVYLYERKLAGLELKEILVSSGKIIGASILMGLLVWPIFQGIYGAVEGTQTLRLLAGVLGSIGISVPIYLALCLLFRVREVGEAIAWLREARGKEEAIERVGEEPL